MSIFDRIILTLYTIIMAAVAVLIVVLFVLFGSFQKYIVYASSSDRYLHSEGIPVEYDSSV